VISPQLNQARRGIKKLIDQNKSSIIISRQAMVDDGFGGLVPDPLGVPTEINVTCRLSHDQIKPGSISESPAGVTSDPIRYILTDHNQDIQENDIFEAIDKTWKIGIVDQLYAFGGLIGKQAPVILVNNEEAET
jgi:hypothetical protein